MILPERLDAGRVSTRLGFILDDAFPQLFCLTMTDRQTGEHAIIAPL